MPFEAPLVVMTPSSDSEKRDGTIEEEFACKQGYDNSNNEKIGINITTVCINSTSYLCRF